MSVPPAVPSGSPTAAKTAAQRRRKSKVTFERLVGWALPLMTIFLLLGALEEAVREHQLRWASVGIAVYLVSLGMWLALKLVRSKQVTVARPSSYPTSQPETEVPQPAFGWRFAEFGEWFFPFLAVMGLVVASYLAARRGEQSWVVSGAITFAGCFLVWVGWLVRPFRQSSKKAVAGYSSDPSPSLNPMEYLVFAGLLLLSLGLVSGAIAFTQTGLRVRWLFMSLGCFVAYMAAAIGRVTRTTLHEQVRNGVLETVAAAVALVALAAALATATWFHRLSWIGGAVIGVCACLALWLLQIFRSLPRDSKEPIIQYPSYSRFPWVLLAGLLAFAGFAVHRGEVPALWGAGWALLGGLAVWFSWMFVVSVEQEGPPQVESNWAGLGGGLGGWRFSASLIYALCALTLAVVAGSGLYQPPKEVPQNNVTNQTKSSADSNAATSPAKPKQTRTEPSNSNKPQSE
jgi:hypothetical protein